MGHLVGACSCVDRKFPPPKVAIRVVRELKGLLRGEEHRQTNATRPHVCLLGAIRVVFVRIVDLWRLNGRGTDVGMCKARTPLVFPGEAQTEIAELELIALVEEEVRELQIAMVYTLCMQPVQSFKELARKEPCDVVSNLDRETLGRSQRLEERCNVAILRELEFDESCPKAIAVFFIFIFAHSHALDDASHLYEVYIVA